MNFLTSFTSPWGIGYLEWNHQGILNLFLPGTVFDRSKYIEKEIEPYNAVKQLNLYFEKKLRHFDIPLVIEGTEFQKAVWKGLGEIPYGETWSYSRLATFIDSPKSSRAVGNANHANPIPIIIPCHRVVRADGGLGGYGGGVSLKENLITLESVD